MFHQATEAITGFNTIKGSALGFVVFNIVEFCQVMYSSACNSCLSAGFLNELKNSRMKYTHGRCLDSVLLELISTIVLPVWQNNIVEVKMLEMLCRRDLLVIICTLWRRKLLLILVIWIDLVMEGL